MKILVGMAHPKHVYMFKNFIEEMEKRGHEVKILAIEKDITEYLLKRFNMPYTLIGKNPPSIYKKVLSVPKWEYLTLKIARKFKPDIYIGQALPHFAHVSAILRKPYILFEDTESATAVQRVCFPFADAIVTPSCYKVDLGGKQVRFEGYYELAYLHPNYFKPNPTVLDEIGLSKEDKFVIIRFVSWDAIHDAEHSGLTLETNREAVKEFGTYGEVFIRSESSLPGEFEKYRISTPLEKIHDLMYYATLLYGESATMASECAVLGTHAIFCDFVGRGYTDDEEEKYGLVFNFKLDEESQRNSLEKAVELLGNNNLKSVGEKKRERLLEDKIDVTAFMAWFIENYPESFKEMKENPKVQEKFK
jgi:predicted glycosyltransferase